MPIEFPEGYAPPGLEVSGQTHQSLLGPSALNEDDHTFFQVAGDVGVGLVGSAFKATYDLYSTGADITNAITGAGIEVQSFNEALEETPEDALIRFLETETSAGRITRDVGSFVVGLVGISKFTKGFKAMQSLREAGKAGQLSAAMINGALTDFIVADPESPRLANFMPESLSNPIVEFLRYDPNADEGRLEARLKNTIEGALFAGGLHAIGSKVVMPVLRNIKKNIEIAEFGARGAGDERLKTITGIDEALLRDTSKPLTRSLEVLDDVNFSEAGKLNAEFIAAERSARAKITTRLQKAFEKELRGAIKEINKNPNAPDPFSVVGKFIKDIDFGKDSSAALDFMRRTAGIISKEIKKIRAKNGTVFNKDEALKALEPITRDPEKLYSALLNSGLDHANMEARIIISKALIDRNKDDMLASAVKTLAGDASDLTMTQFMADVDLYLETFPLFKGVFSAAGRNLHALQVSLDQNTFKRLANTVEVDIQSSKTAQQQIADILSEAGGKGGVKGLAKRLIEAGGDLKKIESALSRSNNQTFLDKIHQLRIANMLGGIPTQSINFLSAATRVFVERVWENGITAVVDAVRPTIAGAEKFTFGEYIKGISGIMEGTRVYMQDLVENSTKHGWNLKNAKAIIDDSGVETFTRATAENIHLGGDLLDPARSGVVSRPLVSFMNSYHKFSQGLVFQTMNLFDSGVKSAAFRSHAKGLSYRLGMSLGKQGDDLTKFVDNITEAAQQFSRDPRAITQLLRRQMTAANLTKDEIERTIRMVKRVHDESILAGRQSTFQQELPESLQGLESWLNSGSDVAKLVKTVMVPFFRTPVNIVNFTLERTPVLQAFSKEWRDAILGRKGSVEASKAVAKMVNGAIMYSTAAQLVSMKMVTGSHPKDERDDLLTAGIPEYSIFVPMTGQYFKYNRFDPFGLFLGTVADAQAAIEFTTEGEIDKVINTLVMTASNNVVNKTYMKGLSDLFMMFDDPDRFQERFTINQATVTLNPLNATQKSIDAIFDRDFEDPPDLVLSDIRTIIDNIFRDAPGNELPVKTTVFGEKISRPEGAFNTIAELAGFRPSRPSESLGLQELARMKILPRNSELTLVSDLEMTQEEFREFKKILRTDLGFSSVLDSAVASGEYQALGDLQRKKFLNSLTSSYRRQAKEILIARDPEIVAKVIKAEHLKFFNLLTQSSVGRSLPNLSEVERLNAILTGERPRETDE